MAHLGRYAYLKYRSAERGLVVLPIKTQRIARLLLQ